MHWNYRLYQHDVDGEPVCEIVEAFYTDEAFGMDTPYAWAEASGPYGECPEDVKQLIEWMTSALAKPVLTPENFSPLDPEDFQAPKDYNRDIERLNMMKK